MRFVLKGALLLVCVALAAGSSLLPGCARRDLQKNAVPPTPSERAPSARAGVPWETLGGNQYRDSFTRETLVWPLSKRPLWRKKIDEKEMTENYTILMKDDRVFVGTFGGSFLCFNAETGERVWRTTLLSPYTREAPVRVRLPSLVGNLVVAGDVKGTAYALDASTGAVRWTMRASDGFSASAVGNADVVAMPCLDGALYLRDAATGDARGGFVAQQSLFGDPVLVGDLCWVGSTDHNIYGVNVKTGKLDTIFEASGAVQQPIVYSDGRIFATDSESNLFCINAKDGRLLWQRLLPETNGLLFPGVWRSYILIQDKDLALHVMRAEDGKDVRVLPMKGVTMGAPIGTPNKIVAMTSMFLHVEPAEDPKTIERFRSLGKFKTIRGRTFFVVDRSWLYVIDPNGWHFDEVREMGKHQAGFPALAYGKFVVETGDGYLEAYADSSQSVGRAAK